MKLRCDWYYIDYKLSSLYISFVAVSKAYVTGIPWATIYQLCWQEYPSFFCQTPDLILCGTLLCLKIPV